MKRFLLLAIVLCSIALFCSCSPSPSETVDKALTCIQNKDTKGFMELLNVDDTKTKETIARTALNDSGKRGFIKSWTIKNTVEGEQTSTVYVDIMYGNEPVPLTRVYSLYYDKSHWYNIGKWKINNPYSVSATIDGALFSIQNKDINSYFSYLDIFESEKAPVKDSISSFFNATKDVLGDIKSWVTTSEELSDDKNSATVKVDITYSKNFNLVRENGEWKICRIKTPSHTVEKALKCVQNMDSKGYLSCKINTDNSNIKEQISISDFVEAKHGGGLKSWTIMSEKIVDGGKTAVVEVELVYGNNETPTKSTYHLVFDSGKWKIE